MKLKAEIMNQEDITRTLKRLSHQIIEKNIDLNNLCLIGIKTRGIPLSKRIKEYVKEFSGVDLLCGELDITLYRDDLSKINYDPIVNGTNIPFSIENKNVILVDDVIYTGRTARAGLEALTKLGRPSTVQLCVLIDRGHLELPIKATYVGKNIPTSINEIVSVNLLETDGYENVIILEE